MTLGGEDPKGGRRESIEAIDGQRDKNYQDKKRLTKE